MGNDGGSIPKRRELVKNAARAPTVTELKATALESLAHAWEHCAISGAPLDIDAVVSDWRGRLYNYEAILNGLMPSDDPAEVTPASLGIRSLRDVSKLKVSKSDGKPACPISMKELGPATKAVYIVPCGHVFAEVAMKEIQVESCPECGDAFSQDNVISILPTTEKETSKLSSRIEGLRAKGLTHTLKKDKSEKNKKKRKAEDTRGEEKAEEQASKTQRQSNGQQAGNGARDGDARISGINNPMAATLTARVLAEQDERNKRRKMAAEAVASG